MLFCRTSATVLAFVHTTTIRTSRIMATLVTGVAGFIGFHCAKRLLEQGCTVIGIDNLNPYYDPALKRARLAELHARGPLTFREGDIADRATMEDLFGREPFTDVLHLAAQAGVRYSLREPRAYIQSNLVGFLNVLEGCRHGNVGHLVFASSSSVYGSNARLPFSASDNVDHPLSLYAATKKSNELMAHAYSHLYRLPATGLRFFTVYGPWGRPDMAMFIFAKAILAGEPITLFNHGKMRRDFTYVDDVVESVVRLLSKPPAPDPAWDAASPDPSSSNAPYRIYNIGNHSPVDLTEVISTLENALGRKAKIELGPMHPGDVPATFADVDQLQRDIGFSPSTSIQDGIGRFVDWYRSYESSSQRE